MDELKQLKEHYHMLKKSHVDVPEGMERFMKDISMAMQTAGSNFNKPRLLNLADYTWVELKNSFTIGSKKGNSLVLKHQNIDDYHCQIRQDSKDWMIENLSTISDTFINGRKVKSKILPCSRGQPHPQ